ncbi:MAG: aminoacetone oxidase family FAD-binding enzyme [Sulfurospirillaceae bacterium]|nr:aminoacetone oxidase family FAD-binding enzyme [Sulfurospirillaceae bacterium]
MKIHDIAFIGAGASALMAIANIKNKDIALIDSNTKVGAKVLISGGGKCNLTNLFATSKNYLGDENFINIALSKFTPEDMMSFAKAHHIELEERLHGQMFCAKSAKDLVSVFEKKLSTCKLYMQTKVLHVEKNEHFIIHTDNGKIFAKKLVVSSGGLSYATIGASGIGYEIAEHFGHKVTTPNPALVGFTLQKEQFWMKELSGIAMPVHVRVEGKSFSENLLFAHKGISGPCVLSASLYWKKGKINIDFLPEKSLSVLLKASSNKQISTALPLPKRFMKAFLDSISLEDKVVSKLKNDEKIKLEQLKNYEFSPAGNFGFTKAEVTKGGVCTDEIDPQTFESLLCQNLYFIGEVLDVTGELGGFNFQWAFASGFCLAKTIL